MEEITLVIPLAYRPKSFGRKDSFTIVCTSTRTIFAKFTIQMMKDAVNEARAKAKEKGKGFFGQWGAQLTSTTNYHKRYMEMNPDDILAQTEGNFALSYNDIVKLRVKKKVSHDQDSFEVKTEMLYETAQGKYKFMIDSYSKDTVEALKRVYGAKIQT